MRIGRRSLMISLSLGGLLAACSGGDTLGGGTISLDATARSQSQIYLSWSKPVSGISVSDYVIAFADQTRPIGSTPDRNFLVSGLTPGTRYCFVIRMPITANTMSNTACATTQSDQASPSPPGWIRATALSPVSIEVAWQESYDEWGVQGYRLYRDDAPLVVVEGLSFRDEELTPDTQYCYRVNAFDTYGNESQISEQTCETTLADTSAPDVPGNIVVESSLINGTSVMKVSWSPSFDYTGILSYTVLRDGLVLADTSDTQYEDSNLSPDAYYCYSVIARDLIGMESVVSAEVCARESWRQQPLSESGVGATKIAIDENNVPVVAYKQRYWTSYASAETEYRSTLKVGRIDEEFTSETLDDSAAEFSPWGEFKLGMLRTVDGKLHIVHQSNPAPGPKEMQHVIWGDTGTERSTISSGFDRLSGASIDVDSVGNLHGCFNYDSWLYYGTTNSGTWSLARLDEVIAGAGEIVGIRGADHCEIVVGIDDTIHIVFLGVFSNVWYATQSMMGWLGELIDRQSTSTSGTPNQTSIAVDSNGAVHIAYAHDYAESDVEYATNASGNWVTEKIDGSGTAGYSSAIAVTSKNQVYIVYEKRIDTDTQLNLATRVDGLWETSILSSIGGNKLSIAVDSNDHLHLVSVPVSGSLTYLTNSR